jgi:hypothetical protein
MPLSAATKHCPHVLAAIDHYAGLPQAAWFTKLMENPDAAFA